MTAFIFLLPALVAALVLTGIHTYLGIHVVSRGVIFVDIALAQIAALGLTIALAFGFEPDSQIAYFFALGFTSFAALFFAYFRDDRIPQEAIIGVSFAVSSAVGILIAAHIPHGAEHLQHVLSGNILWVTWPQIFKTALIYAALGLLHYRFRDRFLALSTGSRAALAARGIRPARWDLLFYLSFGLVITSSVQMAGILLVFSFLIVPALCSMLFYSEMRRRLFLGWGIGAVTSALGITASYVWDLPTGPTIVAGFGLVLFVTLLLRKKPHSKDSFS